MFQIPAAGQKTVKNHVRTTRTMKFSDLWADVFDLGTTPRVRWYSKDVVPQEKCWGRFLFCLKIMPLAQGPKFRTDLAGWVENMCAMHWKQSNGI